MKPGRYRQPQRKRDYWYRATGAADKLITSRVYLITYPLRNTVRFSGLARSIGCLLLSRDAGHALYVPLRVSRQLSHCSLIARPTSLYVFLALDGVCLTPIV